jgi:hypothetical protein
MTSKLFIYPVTFVNTNDAISPNDPDASVTISGGIAVQKTAHFATKMFTAGLDAGNTIITQVATPILSTDAVNKSYVDGITISTDFTIDNIANVLGISSSALGTGLLGGTGVSISVNPTQTLDNLTITTSATFSGIVVNGIATPLIGTDAVNKNYVDGLEILAGTGLTKTINTLSVNTLQTQITSIGTLTGLTVSGTSSITNTTDSVSTGTGSLITTGGIGVAKSLYIGLDLNVNSGLFVVDTGTGSVQFGDSSFYTQIQTGNPIINFESGNFMKYDRTNDKYEFLIANTVIASLDSTFFSVANTTESNSVETGALTISGGIGIAKNAYIGGSLVVTGGLTLPKLTIVGNKSGPPTGYTGAYLTIPTSIYTDNTTLGSGNAGIMTFNTITAPTLDATNTLVTTDSAATMYISGPPAAGTNQTITNKYALWVGGSGTGSGHVKIEGNLNVEKNLSILDIIVTSTIDSTNSTSGALQVAGGLGIAKSLFVASTTDSSSISNGSIVVSGGIGIAKSLVIGGDFTANTAYGSMYGLQVDVGFDIKTTGISGDPSINFGSKLRLQSSNSHDITTTSTATNSTPLGMVYIDIPSYSSDNTSVTTTSASTVYIAGSPTNGTNNTITNSYSLNVNSGVVRIGDTTTGGISSGALVISGGVYIGDNLGLQNNILVYGDNKGLFFNLGGGIYKATGSGVKIQAATLGIDITNSTNTLILRRYTDTTITDNVPVTISDTTTVGTTTNSTLSSGGSLNVAGDLVLGATSPKLFFPSNGLSPPLFTNRSIGTKIVLFSNIGPANVDYSIGIDTSTLWQSVPSSTEFFKWYAGITEVMSLSGTGTLSTSILNLGPGTPIQNSMLSLYGPGSSLSGPHIIATTDADVYPLFQLLNNAHDNIALSFDCYWTGTIWASSDLGSNFQISKAGDTLNFNYKNGIAPGGNTSITASTALSISSTGTITLQQATSSTTTGTGALVVIGGVGIGGNVNIGGDIFTTGYIKTQKSSLGSANQKLYMSGASVINTNPGSTVFTITTGVGLSYVGKVTVILNESSDTNNTSVLTFEIAGRQNESTVWNIMENTPGSVYRMSTSIVKVSGSTTHTFTVSPINQRNYDMIFKVELFGNDAKLSTIVIDGTTIETFTH